MKKLNENQSGVAHLAAIALVVVILAIGGVGWYVWKSNNRESKTTVTPPVTKNENSTIETTQETENETKPETKYLEIKEYGVKIVLTKDIEDAYHVMNPYPYLSVRSLDKYKWCKLVKGDESTSGIAAVSKGKVGDDNVGSPITVKELEERSSLKIGEYYYWVELGNGGSCSDPSGNNPDDKEGKVRKAFSDAELQKL